MIEEIKEILDKFSNRKQVTLLQAIRELKEQDVKHACVTTEENINKLLNYITNLQKENEKLKDNQVRALNKIKDCISASKCEILEGNYSNDKHSQYWNLFNKQLKEIQKLIKGVNINQYINIPKYREKELLNKEEKLEDYKQRNEKAIEYINLFKDDVRGLDDMVLLNILKGGDE